MMIGGKKVMRKKLFIISALLLLFLCSAAQASSGDLPNYLTLYGEDAVLVDYSHQDANKFYNAYERYKYECYDDSVDLTGPFAEALEACDLFPAETVYITENNIRYFFEYRGWKDILPLRGLVALDQVKKSHPCMMIQVETSSLAKGTGPAIITLTFSSDLNYLEPDFSGQGEAEGTIHLHEGEAITLSFTADIPEYYGKLSETYHWEVISGQEIVFFITDENMKEVELAAFQPGRAVVRATYTYSYEGTNVLTGSREYKFSSTPQTFNLIVD